MANKKDLSGVLEPNYGSECIMYATGAGWAYGERTTSAEGVSYTDAEAVDMTEPADWKRCNEDSCSGAEVMSVCGPVQLAGMGDLVKALTPAPADMAAKLCGDEAAVAGLKDCLGIKEPVTYEFTETNPNDGDGVIVFTAAGSDGSSQDITLAEPVVDVDTVYTGHTLVDGVLTQTFEDTEGNPLPDRVQDLSALISAVDQFFKSKLTTNPDGTITHQTFDADGNPDGDAFTFAAPVAAGSSSSLTVDAASRSYAHSDGDGNDTSLPVATALSCTITTPSGLVDDKYLSDFVDQGHIFSGVNVAGVTTPCNRSVIATAGATLSNRNTAAIAGSGIEITQPFAVGFGQGIVSSGSRSLTGGLNVDASGLATVAIGNSIVAPARFSAIFGSAINAAGGRHITSGELINIGADTIDCAAIGSTLNIESGVTKSTAFNTLNTISANVVNANVRGSGTTNPTSHTSVWGFEGATGASLTSNRTAEIDHPTGNITISGTLTTGAVFAGFGEHAIAAEKIPEGTLVVFEGGASVRIAKEGEAADGVTTKDLVISAGGGVDPDNSMYLLDEMGNRQIVEQIKDEVVESFDQKSYEKALSKLEDGEEIDKAAFIIETKKPVKVMVPVRNPKYDPEKTVEKVAVELLGRQWALNPNKLEVGDFMQGGAISGESGFRVLAVKEGMALLLVK